jgi:hypothetical protein
LCCPSTLEFNDDTNGFYLLDVYPNKLAIRLMEWDGTDFNLNQQESKLVPF